MKPIDMLALHLDYHGSPDEVIQRAIDRLSEDTKALAQISEEAAISSSYAEECRCALAGLSMLLVSCIKDGDKETAGRAWCDPRWIEAQRLSPNRRTEIGTGWIEHTDSDGKVKREPTTAEGTEFLRQAEEGHAVRKFRAARCCPCSVTCEREQECCGLCPVHCHPEFTEAMKEYAQKLLHPENSQYSLPAGAWVEHGGGWVKVHALQSTEAAKELYKFLESAQVSGK